MSFSRSSLIRWGVRFLAVAMVAVAVVLVMTVPTQAGLTCIVSPWSHWRGVPSPYNIPFPRPAQWQQHLVSCAAVMSDCWHIAWGLGLGAILLLVGSFIPRRALGLGHRRVHRPSTA